MKICALVLTLAFAVSGQEIEDSDTWARLQIGQEVFTTLHYGDLEVKVYEQLRKPNATKKETKPWYYFMPINLLLPDSAECIFNTHLDRDELRFSIQFWNDDLRQRIVEHLHESEGIENAKVAVIPFEQVILATTEPSQFYRPTNSWVPYRGQKLMNFSLIFGSKTKCRELQDNTRSNPHHIHHFRLMFNVAATNARSRIALISVDSIRKGSLFSKLDQKFPHAGSVLLTADDTNRLLSESKAEIMVETFDDNEVPNPSSEARIYEMLHQLLIDSRETIKEQSSQLWSSVFYENENYRPDQVTQSISDIYRRSDEEAQKMLSSLFSNSKSSNIDAALELIKHRLSSRADGDAESSSKSDRSGDTSSKSQSDISSSGKLYQFRNKDEERRNSESSFNYTAGGSGLGFEANVRLDIGDKKSNGKVTERSGNNATSAEVSSSRGISESQEKAREEMQLLSRQRDRSDVSNDQLAEKLARASADSEEEKKEMQEIFKLLLEGKERVEWQGGRFQPRPMTLSRANLAKVRTKTSFGSHDVKVTYSKATLTAGVNVASNNSLETIYWLAEMQKKQSNAFENMDSKMKKMNDQLAGTLKDVKIAFEKIDSKMKAVNETLSQKLANVETRLQETADDLKTKETEIVILIRQEREKFKVLADTVEDVANQSNATRNQLAETQRNYESNRQIDTEAVAVVGNKLKTLESSTINQSNAAQSQLSEVQRSCQRNLREAIVDVTNKLKTLESTTINHRNASRSELGEVQRTCERNLKEAGSDVNNKLNSLESQQKTEMECLKRSGPDSNCLEFRDMGCYCIFEVKKDLYEATDYCERNNMKLVAIETREENDFIQGFLTKNLGNREKYDSPFWTSGFYEKSDGRWKWTSSKRSLLFGNWGKYNDHEKMNRLFISQEKPFAWFNEYDYYNHSYYFVCEISSPQQEIRNLKKCPSNIGVETKCFDNGKFSCYCLADVKLDVTEAARFCQSHAMRLLSIESSAEEEHLTKIIEASNFGNTWWTSGSDIEVKNTWVWTATGRPVQYTNWYPGQPNNVGGEEHYIAIYVSGGSIEWHDFPAESRDGRNGYIKTICEY